MSQRETESRGERLWQIWWPKLRDVGGFTLGSFILVWQTVYETSAQIVLVVAGIALLGVPASAKASRWLEERLTRS